MYQVNMFITLWGFVVVVSVLPIIQRATLKHPDVFVNFMISLSQPLLEVFWSKLLTKYKVNTVVPFYLACYFAIKEYSFL